MNGTQRWSLAYAALIAMASFTTARANGYKILGVKSARATAMGEAFVAQADAPEAVAINLLFSRASSSISRRNGSVLFTGAAAPECDSGKSERVASAAAGPSMVFECAHDAKLMLSARIAIKIERFIWAEPSIKRAALAARANAAR